MKYSSKQKGVIILELSYGLAMIVIGTVIALLYYNSNPVKYRPTIVGLELIAGFGLGLLLYIYLTNHKRHVLKTYLVAALVSSLILIVAASIS